MEALLVTGGKSPSRNRLESRLSSFGLICAADSGLDTVVAWGLEPGLIVGDMDSVSSPEIVRRFPRAELILAERDKDETDTELALSAIAARGADRVVLAGGGEGRLDHLLAIRSIFERRAALRPSEWHTAGEALFLVEEGRSLALDAIPGSLVSVFPLAAGAEGMTSEGLKWPLAGLSWGAGGCGVSNVAVMGRFAVTAGKGDLLVVLLLDSPVEGGH